MLSRDRTYRRGDIYYADLNLVYGSEQGGMRSVAVIQSNTGNKYAPTLIVATVATKVGNKPSLPTHYLIRNNNTLAELSAALLEQIRTIGKKRIKSYLGKTTKRKLLRIDKAPLKSLSLNYLICIKEPRN